MEMTPDSFADGKYPILEILGDGGFGRVYRGRHRDLQRDVAIKVLHSDLLDRNQIAIRFHQEALATSRLQHPNIVQVLDFGEEGRQLYIVMEYLDGPNLFDLMRTEPPAPLERLLEIMIQVCAALAAAHDQGIVHRDMKPENVMIIDVVDDEGRATERAKVCDFGLAKILLEERDPDAPSLTGVGEINGTPAYMSPEQAQGKNVDLRSDLYAVGVMLYQIVTGKLPFESETPVGLLMQHITQPPPPPSTHAPDCPPDLEAIILRCLAKEPHDRFQDARTLRAALLAWLQGADPRAKSTPSVTLLSGAEHTLPAPIEARPTLDAEHLSEAPLLPPSPAKKERRNPVPLVAIVLLITAAALIAGLLIGRSDDPPDAEAAQHTPPPPETQQPPEPPGVNPPREMSPPQPVPTASRQATRASLQASLLAGARGLPSTQAAAASEEDTDPPRRKPKRTPKEKPKAEEDDPDPPTEEPTEVDVVVVKEEKTPVEEVAVVVVEPPKPEPPPLVAEASASIEGLKVDGSLPKRTVERALEKQIDEVEGCYRKAARKAGRDQDTTLDARLEIDFDGRARNVSVKGDSLPGLNACVTDVLATARTRDRPDTGGVIATFRLILQPKRP